MKQKLYTFFVVLLCLGSGRLLGQVDLGDKNKFISGVKEQLKAAKLKASVAKGAKPTLTLNTPDGLMTIEIGLESESGKDYLIRGLVAKNKNSNFFLDLKDGEVSGAIIIGEKAYRFDQMGNSVNLNKIDIHELICHDFTPPAKKSESISGRTVISSANSPEVLRLQSLPGAAGCIYMDFDGEYVVGTRWLGGAAVNAQPANVSDAVVREAWELVSEDYRPFNINVTTDRSVFNSYPKNKRMMCINTPTKTVTSTGVAYIGSFSWNDDTPCWNTLLSSAKTIGEVISHELGHTLDLLHDGRNLSSGKEEYYKGHNGWSPIMGTGYNNGVVQFSKGEYASANNLQDDLALISGTKFGLGYRTDDYSNSISGAKPLSIGANGQVSAANNKGIIERTSDVDYFTFSTSGGTITLNINTVTRHGNLDILARLYNQTGSLLGTYNPSGLNSTISTTLASGTYFVSIDGTGNGSPITGYSEYASLGSYFISGTIPAGVVALRTPENPTNTVNGIDYKYYEGNWSSLPTFSSLSEIKKGTVANFNITPRDKNDLFGFQFNGFVRVPQDGNYTFYTTSDDGSKLFIGNTEVVNHDGLHGATEASGSIGLKAGVHAITVLYFEQAGDEILDVSFSGPGLAKQTIPASALYRINSTTLIQAPYGGTAWPIPGKIEAENFDVGGEGIAYHETEPTNVGNGNYRTEGVDLENCTDLGGGFNLGYIRVGEWIEYTVNVLNSSVYKLDLRTASAVSGKSLRIEMDGAVIASNILIPNTGGWQSYQTVTVNGINLTQGVKVMRLVAISDDVNINYITFSSSSVNRLPAVSITSPINNSVLFAPTNITINANAMDVDGTISKVEFYQGTTKIGEDLTAPFSLAWLNVPAGNYSLSAKATDNQGGVSTSAPVNITLNASDVCSALPQYAEGGSYVAGSKVKNNGRQFECKESPFSGWCNGAAWAYEPGVGAYWTDAWYDRGTCAARFGNALSVNEDKDMKIMPNPAQSFIAIETHNAEQIEELYIIDGYGKSVVFQNNLSSGALIMIDELASGVYVLKIKSPSGVFTKQLIKQ